MNKTLSHLIIALSDLSAFACQAEETIKLQQPVEIKEHLYYRDGGTACVTLKDKIDKQITFCFDYGMGSKTKNRLFYGAAHPSFIGAKLIETGSTLENTALSLIHEAIDSICNKNRQNEISEKQTAEGLSSEELNIWHLFNALKRYDEN